MVAKRRLLLHLHQTSGPYCLRRFWDRTINSDSKQTMHSEAFPRSGKSRRLPCPRRIKLPMRGVITGVNINSIEHLRQFPMKLQISRMSCFTLREVVGRPDLKFCRQKATADRTVAMLQLNLQLIKRTQPPCQIVDQNLF